SYSAAISKPTWPLPPSLYPPAILPAAKALILAGKGQIYVRTTKTKELHAGARRMERRQHLPPALSHRPQSGRLGKCGGTGEESYPRQGAGELPQRPSSRSAEVSAAAIAGQSGL